MAASMWFVCWQRWQRSVHRWICNGEERYWYSTTELLRRRPLLPSANHGKNTSPDSALSFYLLIYL